jgi:1,2-dihydroxy-3-keto-5-methylthiopentene dioxygenase
MTRLTIYSETNHQQALATYSDSDAIATELAKVNIKFERWQANQEIADDADNETILEAYRQDIDRLIEETGYQTFDVISINENHPQKKELRQKFLAEHIHEDDEIRFFIKGKGLFALHIDDKVYELICEQNDLISVPAGTPHWFDMGANPNFTCIRIFDTPEGWVAKFTGSDIAEQFSCLAT